MAETRPTGAATEWKANVPLLQVLSNLLEDHIFVIISVIGGGNILIVLFTVKLRHTFQQRLLFHRILSSIFCLNLHLLLSLYQLEASKILALQLVKLSTNVIEHGFNFRNRNILQRVHSSVCHLQGL